MSGIRNRVHALEADLDKAVRLIVTESGESAEAALLRNCIAPALWDDTTVVVICAFADRSFDGRREIAGLDRANPTSGSLPGDTSMTD